MQHADDFIERDLDDPLDPILRVELRWEAPPELTTRLLNLVPAATASHAFPSARGTRVSPRRPQPSTWYVMFVMLLTSLTVVLSFGVAWKFYAIVGSQLGLSELWQQIQYAPSGGLDWLAEHVPAVRMLAEFLPSIQEQIQWVLMVAVLWLALDSWSPRLPRLRRLLFAGSRH